MKKEMSPGLVGGAMTFAKLWGILCMVLTGWHVADGNWIGALINAQSTMICLLAYLLFYRIVKSRSPKS